jgi:hypothetical protein
VVLNQYINLLYLILNKNAIGIIRADYITKKVKLTKEVLETLHYLAIKLPGYLTK